MRWQSKHMLADNTMKWLLLWWQERVWMLQKGVFKIIFQTACNIFKLKHANTISCFLWHICIFHIQEYINTGRSSEAMQWFRYVITSLSLWRPTFNHRQVHVEFLVDKWHWHRLFTEYFSLPLSASFHQCSTRIQMPITDAI